jgi:site-specific DNA recombinase
MTTVAIYSRLSQDPDGAKTSTARQETDCRALAKARGWKVVEAFRDNGISGYSGKERPAFERMLSALDAGEFEGLLAWKVDRLGRRVSDVVQLLDRVNGHGGFVATCDGLDSGTPMGKGVMQIGAIFAEMESTNNAARTQRGKLQIAQDGLPSGGGRRAYGYTADGLTVIPEEAQRIKQMASDVIAGRSLRSIVARLRAEDVPTSTGGPWFPQALRRMLLSPRIAGFRTHRGEVIGPAVWPAIISVEQHEQLVAVLTDPKRRTSRPGARLYLLTGSTNCGRCGSVMVASPRNGKRAYVCRSQRRGMGCGGVRIVAEAFENHVAELMLDALDSSALTKMRRSAGRSDGRVAALTKDLRKDEAALERLTVDHYTEGRLRRSEFLAAHDRLIDRIGQTQRRLADLTAGRTVAALPSAGTELRSQWAIADLEWRRALVEAVVERIEVGPSRARGQTDLDRVEVTFRGK